MKKNLRAWVKSKRIRRGYTEEKLHHSIDRSSDYCSMCGQRKSMRNLTKFSGDRYLCVTCKRYHIQRVLMRGGSQ